MNRCAAVIIAAALGGCGRLAERPPSSPPPAMTVGAPLPAGWAWPVNAQMLAQGLAPYTVYRPMNVAALQALQGTSPCAPVEVAPSIWVKPLCAKLPPLALSPAAEERPPAPHGFAPPPMSVNLRDAGLDGPIKDQQQVGVCWSFALSTLMDNALRRAGRAEVLAPLHLITHDEYRLLHRRGSGLPIVPESSWPYDPHKACKLDEDEDERPYCWNAYGIVSGSWRADPALIAERARAEATGAYRILKLQRLSRSPANPDELARVIAEGQAVYGGFDIDLRRWSTKSHLPGSVIPDWDPTDSGGHAVVLVGYRTTLEGRQFLIHNSWGPGWGDKGYAWVSERMIRARMDDAFTVTVGDASGNPLSPQAAPPVPVLSPPPISSLPQPPSSSGCAPGTVRDPVLGWCFQACPDGSSPVLGFCAPPGAGPTQGSPPAQPTSNTAGCAPGAVRDRILGLCFQQCPDGSSPIFGICAPGGSAPGSSGGAPVCPAGQTADLLTRQCSSTCPSGSPRVGGFCWF